jgi:hypothetical protein
MAAKTIEIAPEVRDAYAKAIEALVTETEYSAYGIHTVLNKLLAAAGREGVRPQMMYNYARNGLIVPGVKITGETLRTFTAEEVTSFIIKYLVRNNVAVAGVEVTQQTKVETETPVETQDAEPTTGTDN